jgi:hypothetical protein
MPVLQRHRAVSCRLERRSRRAAVFSRELCLAARHTRAHESEPSLGHHIGTRVASFASRQSRRPCRDRVAVLPAPPP